MSALPSTPAPSQSSQKTRKFRALSSQYGDGYKDTAPDGINNIIDTWVLVYENLDSSDASTIVSFFDGVGSWDTFTWTAFGDATEKNWRVVEVLSQVFLAGAISSITVQIEQAY